MDGWMDGWMDGRTDGWMDGWIDGWMDGSYDSWWISLSIHLESVCDSWFWWTRTVILFTAILRFFHSAKYVSLNRPPPNLPTQTHQTTYYLYRFISYEGSRTKFC